MHRFVSALVVAGSLLLNGSNSLAGEPDVFSASRSGDLAAVTGLLDRDPELVNARTAAGETPLHYAADGRQAEVLDLLLVRGAEVNAADNQGHTPLHVAALINDQHVIQGLLAAGADAGATDVRGETPLHLAARRFHLQAVQALISAGADVNARNLVGEAPLHVLGSAGRPDVDEAGFAALLDTIAAVLIDAGADPTLLDDNGNPAWPHAAPGGGEPRQPSGYPTYDSIAATLLARANSYPSICQRVDLGTSVQGRHIYALKISDNVGVEEDEPEFKYIANMHGDEVTGVIMCLDLIDYLLQNYGSIPRVTDDVNNIEIWIVPSMNPDGYMAVTRENATGDDLNRSFPEGAPPSPEPNTPTGRPVEVGVIMNWVSAHSFTHGANLHGGSLVVNYPYDNPGNASQYTTDQDLFVYVSEQYSSHNLPMWNSSLFYHGITNGADWYVITGGMQDWNYRYMGCNEVTIELGTKIPAYTAMPTYWNDNRESMLAYLETCLIGVRGIVTDGATGFPLAATVTVAGRGHPVYTDPNVGDYHRMLLPGTYNLTFTAAGYSPMTVPNVVVNSGPATHVDVIFINPPTITYPNGGENLTANVPVNVTWRGNSLAQYQVQYSANYGQMGPVADGFESGSLDPMVYTTGGNLPWTVTTSSAHTGTHSARAGAITDSQSTWMSRAAAAGPLSFWYRVSSEYGYDFFNFYIDGVQILQRSGTYGWTQYSTTLASGNHILKWEYTKDSGYSAGSDTVWIDDLALTIDTTAWSDIVALTPTGATSTPWTPTTPGSMYKVRARGFVNGTYTAWDESNALFSVIQPVCNPADLDGDINQDGNTDGFDVQALVDALLTLPTQTEICHGDYNDNNQLDVGDVAGFVTALLGA